MAEDDNVPDNPDANAEVEEEKEKSDESDQSSEEEDEDEEMENKADKIGNKKRDLWEKETAYKKSARRSAYLVVVNSNDEKDKTIKEQAKSLHLPLLEIEENIVFLKGLPQPKEKKAREKLVKRLEGNRRARHKLHERLHELCVAQKYGWKVVTRFQNDRLEGEEKEVQRAVERVRRDDDKRSGGPSSKS